MGTFLHSPSELRFFVFFKANKDLRSQLRVRRQHGRAELSADYCVSNTVTRVRLRLQAASFDTYADGWRLEERKLTSRHPHLPVLIQFVEQ